MSQVLVQLNQDLLVAGVYLQRQQIRVMVSFAGPVVKVLTLLWSSAKVLYQIFIDFFPLSLSYSSPRPLDIVVRL